MTKTIRKTPDYPDSFRKNKITGSFKVNTSREDVNYHHVQPLIREIALDNIPQVRFVSSSDNFRVYGYRSATISVGAHVDLRLKNKYVALAGYIEEFDYSIGLNASASSSNSKDQGLVRKLMQSCGFQRVL
jgi:hypothetical protein